METHLLPSNRDGSLDKSKLADSRDNRKTIGISKTTLAKRTKSTKLILKKYCTGGNEIKDRIKRSLQLKKSTAPLGASDNTNGDRSIGQSASTHIPQTVAVSAHVNGNTSDDIINEKENHLPLPTPTPPQLQPLLHAKKATDTTATTTQNIVNNRVISTDALNVLVNRNIIAANRNRTHSNSISNTTSINSNYNLTETISNTERRNRHTSNGNCKRRDNKYWPANSTSHSIDAYAINANNMSMYDYHYETASNSTNGSGSIAQSNKYISGGKAHGSAGDPSTFYCTDLVSKQQLCDIALSMASLCNIGNSCYMNSVLYTLRFTPLFLHNLHHLVHDFAQIVSRRETHMKLKSSSLGRNVSGLQGQNSRSYSSKDLASLGATPSSASASSTSSSTSSSLASASATSATAAAAAAASAFDIVKTTQQNAMEKLHELFKNLTSNEVNETTEPYQSDLFLKAIQDVNPIFEGNQQQDAHEFLMCILDSIRESCQALTKLITEHPEVAFNR